MLFVIPSPTPQAPPPRTRPAGPTQPRAPRGQAWRPNRYSGSLCRHILWQRDDIHPSLHLSIRRQKLGPHSAVVALQYRLHFHQARLRALNLLGVNQRLQLLRRIRLAWRGRSVAFAHFVTLLLSVAAFPVSPTAPPSLPSAPPVAEQRPPEAW